MSDLGVIVSQLYGAPSPPTVYRSFFFFFFLFLSFFSFFFLSFSFFFDAYQYSLLIFWRRMRGKALYTSAKIEIDTSPFPFSSFPSFLSSFFFFLLLNILFFILFSFVHNTLLLSRSLFLSHFHFQAFQHLADHSSHQPITNH